MMAALRRDKLLSFALIFVILQLLLAIFAPIVAGDPIEQVIMSRMQGPSLENPLGTDQLGRDVFARILFGYRTSLLTCGVAVVLALIVGGSLGMLAAFYRGWFDRIVMRIMDVLFAFPIILLAIGIIAVLGPNALSASIAIGVVYVPIFARLLRGPSLVICESEYVQGARAIGASDSRIVFTHLLPNLSSLILVQASLLLSAAILVEASLSFLGLGAQPPTPSLGQMLSEGRNFLLLNPWPAVFSGFAILFLSFGFNLLGDALRDTLDPRLRNSTD
ncbi:ABC transporter permease [Ponticoccus sp. SC6-69]|nr:ABC transporter permease [Ponticoccus sp. SC6-36]MBM1287345.1 ABC transporter permease [Ponticoccus sp. SC6-69]MBM1330177.1 ABC transporter permease [Ponticoccus sp. SC6-18]MBM1333855.1 ABC transporter permease [Ponticoccus sp. SC2-30]MBM1338727.1 ABC transporter permease [Ponticoccus sp. SC2-95]MBM1364561.1 ABC transporter permease [Ponticoccus sp. SC2-20]MBM1378266.1 ABC transporter permease [Ponticoccus sp. SC6-64]MBM1387927.1 ABC transporter permease [Ponticoccus sp. SC6-65]